MKPIQWSFPLNPNLYMPVSHSIDKMTSEKKSYKLNLKKMKHVESPIVDT